MALPSRKSPPFSFFMTVLQYTLRKLPSHLRTISTTVPCCGPAAGTGCWMVVEKVGSGLRLERVVPEFQGPFSMMKLPSRFLPGIISLKVNHGVKMIRVSYGTATRKTAVAPRPAESAKLIVPP
jgi:hypothetical protein